MSLINIIIIAIALSMDTFSLSLGISLLFNNNKMFIFPIIVGIFHFIFPIIGNQIGIKLISIIKITPNKLLGIIFMLLFLKLFKDVIYNKENEIKISTANLIILALLVSIDSLITGIGLSNITNLVPMLLFSLVSFIFTFAGLKIGKYAKKELGSVANIIGLLLLLVLSIIHLCK